VNNKATKEVFLTNAPNYDIVHLAMHSVVNEEKPMNSALIFSRESDSLDFILRASEIYGLSLNNQMAVLSACDTGHGKLEKGEGVRSLARAFSYAGSPSLVASLWSAPDRSTKEILVNFYKNLKAGQFKDEALRNAKLTYLDQAPPVYSIPTHWAHLVVIGDAMPMTFSRRLGPVTIIFILIGGFLLAGVIGYSRKRRYRST